MKNLGTVFYFIFIAIITYINVLFGQASQVVYFLEENKTNLYDDAQGLLQAVVIANSRGEQDAFVSQLMDTKVLESSTTSGNLSFYSLTMVSRNSFDDYLAIYLENLTINDAQVKLDNQEDMMVYATITFSDAVSLQGTPKQTFEEVMVTLYDPTQKLLLLPMGALLNQQPTLTIERLVLSYGLLNNSQQVFSQLEEDAFTFLTNEKIQLSLLYQDTYKTTIDVNYLPSLKPAFDNTITLLYGHIFWELVVVIPLTYFLFFHRSIKEMKKKKQISHANQIETK